MARTRLVKCSKEELAYLDAVMGQLSDGMWENSTRMEPYWVCNSLTEEGIEMEPFDTTYSSRRNYTNPLYDMSDLAVRSWFADKLKAVVKEWLKDEGSGTWSRINTEEVSYLNDGQTVAGAYKVYDSLKGRTDKTGTQIKSKIEKIARNIEVGDVIDRRKVVQVIQPLTRRDNIVTIVYENDEVERIEAGKQIEVTQIKVVE
ncbi:MAG: hypothetical protein M0Q88_01180 [Bacilli bacterium]|nr:hypothetical protein [Bacilli bacterium]